MVSGQPRELRQPERALRIIVADDDRDTVLSLCPRSCEQEGYEVSEVYRGDAVLRAGTRIREPDVVLLDIGMPGNDRFRDCAEVA